MAKNNVIGKTEQRWDAIAKVKGQAKFTADFPINHKLHAKILRSTIAHGYVTAYDITEAEQMPGVVKIFLPEDLPQNKFGTAGHPWSMVPAKRDIEDRTLLTRHVRVYGDDIACVVAKTELEAIRALEKIKVTYEKYPVYLTPKAAMADNARRVHEERDNVIADTSVGYGDVAKELKAADYVIKEHFHTPMQQHVHMENQVAVAWQSEDQRWTCISSTQIPYICRRIIGQAVGVPWSQIRVQKPFIGGGFGNKQEVIIEPLVVALSMACGGRPVEMNLTREESIAYTRTRHAIDYDLAVGVNKDGSITAIDCNVYSNQGGYASHGHAIGGKGGTFINALYKTESLRYAAKTIYTNVATAGAMRGYGIPQVMFALESIMDDAAEKIGMDPIDFRIQNRRPEGFLNTLSHVQQFNFKIDKCLQKGREAFHWDEKLQDSLKYKTGSKRRGVGVAGFSYGSGTYPFGLETAGARLTLMPDASFKLMLGATEIGQGADTAFSQMAADTIGVGYDKIIRDAMSDTDIDPFDTGSYASRQTYITGFAVQEAAEKMKQKILKRASEMYDIRPEYMDIVDGNIVYSHNDQKIADLADFAMSSFYDMAHGRAIVAESSVNIHNNSYASGCTLAQVEVDIETGQIELLSVMNVHDSGKIINPILAEGQVDGGMAMGIAYGLSEGVRYNEAGKPLNNNLMDYKIPTTMDLPDLDHAFVESEDPLGPYGNKSLGENPLCSPAAAIRNAVKNATGVAINSNPLASQHVFEQLKQAHVI
ncbi:xanthine dehydrogenase subunit XdhA [Agrilactobacillus composti DSM 18527 = JCM 14202]|uniref:Xanthine dehydrogenase subunit XdhA n=1 Tax=Agrilactobacillus composti DSM 18527 = JCM 14202 TaxID=1423734 RepID=X0PCX3_9LACO|nr:xanthine dehydrogenase subunit XdhA [Agrilactobacillus composti]KRM33166.1 xanthine dehydrogenase subunit XdhA [Agrilactobacillus composti DSM 18527 = JCM 14202]GAF38463.1 xanthine dehydrogenase, molybdenum binding subunit [Agrilactobacillus composti DSM 18527 = JCM 14202]